MARKFRVRENGASETIVPPRIVRLFYRLARGPKTFCLLKGIGHDYRHSKRTIAVVNRRILDFLAIIVPQSRERKTL